MTDGPKGDITPRNLNAFVAVLLIAAMTMACLASVAMADNDKDDWRGNPHPTAWKGRDPRPVPTVPPEPTIEPEPTPEPTAVPTPPSVPTEVPTVTPEPTEEPTVTPDPTATPGPTATPAPAAGPAPPRVIRSYESWEYNPMPLPTPAPEPVALQVNNSSGSALTAPASATPEPFINQTSSVRAVERTGIDLTAGVLFAILIGLIGLELAAAGAVVIMKK